LLTIGQVAERLAVSRATAYRLIAAGELPALRLGGPGHSLRVAEPELQAWLISEGKEQDR
jgi:excisionase family DNA binding protein